MPHAFVGYCAVDEVGMTTGRNFAEFIHPKLILVNKKSAC